MHWTIAAPFFTQANLHDARWLDDFVPGDHHSFLKVHRPAQKQGSWHNRVTRNTSISGWLNYWQYSGQTLQQTKGGCITVFPQLATMVGWRTRFARRKTPVVAWCFNVGALYPGLRRQLAHWGLSHVDKFVVHSRRECETVSQWLRIPQDRFEFVPLQRASIPIVKTEELENPFILSMGSANRDYPTFFQAVEKLQVRTIIVASQRVLKGLHIPPNVEVQSGLTPEECHHLAQQARISIVPLIDHATGSGQVTIVEAMRMGRPVIATRCIGSEDYIDSGRTGILVSPSSVESLTDAISQAWSDFNFRESLGRAAALYAEQYFSDEAAGASLGLILDQF